MTSHVPILGHNLESIRADGSIEPVPANLPAPMSPAMRLWPSANTTAPPGDTQLNRVDLVDLVARTISCQIHQEAESENGLAYAGIGLLSFGPSKERNLVWERLNADARELVDKRLLHRSDYDNHLQAFNIAKSVTRFSLGLSKKDETAALIEKFIERISANSAGGYCDDAAKSAERPDALGGAYDIYGILQFVFIRQALQLHANSHLRERKLPSLRTFAEKYVKLVPDMVRADGLGWCYGRGIGAYGQMHLITIVLQSMRDGWIPEDKLPVYRDAIRRLFQYFFATYIDQEHGFLVIRDGERDAFPNHTTRMANFDAARYLCQWARLAKSVGGDMAGRPAPAPKPSCKYVLFDRSPRKEQGLCIYQDPASGLHVQIPVVSGGSHKFSDSLAFPHMPGVFDWPANEYRPAFIPEATIGGQVFVPSFYGKNISTAMGLKGAFVFKYDQPELITKDEKIVYGVGSWKVEWEFLGGRITGRFTLQVKQQVSLENFRLVLPIATPHHRYHLGGTLTLGPESLRCAVLKDDFGATWAETEVVSEDPHHRTYNGKVHYYQTLRRDHPLLLRPGQAYKLEVTFEPDIVPCEA